MLIIAEYVVYKEDLKLPSRQREEVLNVVMAECISERGMAATPENIITISSRRRAMPDVIIVFRGLRCIIEGKMGDAQNAHRQVADDISDRIVNGIGHIAIGVVYPVHLREVIFANLPDAITSATLDFLVWSEAGSGEWKKGILDTILDELRRVYDILVRDDVLERSVERLQLGMQNLENVLFSNKTACIRLADTLGVYHREDGEELANE